MRKVLIFGHKKPDTDAVTSAIALAELKNELGINAIPYVLGNINNETKFVLDYFHIDEPKYLNDVKLQIKDLNYEKNTIAENNVSIFKCYNYMNNEIISTLPIVDSNKKFLGAVSMKEIAKYLINYNENKIKTSYKNILETLNGEEILKFDDTITGDIIFESYRSTTFIENVILNNNSILIIGDRHSIIERAINKKIKLIIITGNGEIKEENLKLANDNKVNIIKTPLSALKA